ncbi:MAG: chemotaxis protein CheW [Desulfobulbaceae bacterium]
METKKENGQLVIDDCWKRKGVWSESREKCPELVQVIHCRNCPVYSAAGRRLLDRELPEDYIEEWTGSLARIKVEKEEDVNSAFVFRAGGEWLALPASLIQEVVDMGVIHSLPHRNSAILRGVVNIRGKLELCFSIGAILGIERYVREKEKGEKYVSPSRLIVAERDGERVVFPVSEIYGFFRYAEGMLQQLPVTVSGSKAAFTKGVLSVENFDVGLLDDAVLYDAFKRNM